ncbi:hypothetical protein Tco_1337419 [Tanacetum coccineum]
MEANIGCLEKRTLHNIDCLGIYPALPLLSLCYNRNSIPVYSYLPLGAVHPEVALGPALKANDGIGICPLGSWVVVVLVVGYCCGAVFVVICRVCRPAPTESLAGAKLLAVMLLVYQGP